MPDSFPFIPALSHIEGSVLSEVEGSALTHAEGLKTTTPQDTVPCPNS